MTKSGGSGIISADATRLYIPTWDEKDVKRLEDDLLKLGTITAGETMFQKMIMEDIRNGF